MPAEQPANENSAPDGAPPAAPPAIDLPDLQQEPEPADDPGARRRIARLKRVLILVALLVLAFWGLVMVLNVMEGERAPVFAQTIAGEANLLHLRSVSGPGKSFRGGLLRFGPHRGRSLWLSKEKLGEFELAAKIRVAAFAEQSTGVAFLIAENLLSPDQLRKETSPYLALYLREQGKTIEFTLLRHGDFGNHQLAQGAVLPDADGFLRLRLRFHRGSLSLWLNGAIRLLEHPIDDATGGYLAFLAGEEEYIDLADLVLRHTPPAAEQ